MYYFFIALLPFISNCTKKENDSYFMRFKVGDKGVNFPGDNAIKTRK